MSGDYVIPPVGPVQRVEAFFRRVLKLDPLDEVKNEEAALKAIEELVEEELPLEERYSYTAADPMVGKYIDYLA